MPHESDMMLIRITMARLDERLAHITEVVDKLGPQMDALMPRIASLEGSRKRGLQGLKWFAGVATVLGVGWLQQKIRGR